MSDMEQSDVVAPAADAAPAPEPVAPEVTAVPVVEPVPVLQQVPSSASPTQQPEAAPAVVEAPLPLDEAVKALLIFVKGRRTVGDADLDAALADVEAALPAQDAQA